MPSFFLVLEFGGQAEPQRATLVHCDRRLAYRSLERLRRLSAAKTRAPHRLLVTIPIADDDRLSVPDATAFAEMIRSYVGTDLHAYVERKRQWIHAVGYEHGGEQIDLMVRMPIDGRSAQEVLIDFSLGLEPYLEVIAGEVRDLRFGVPSPDPVEVLTNDRIQVNRNPMASGQLTLTSSSGRHATLSGHVYGPVGFSTIVNPDNLKLRFESQFVDVAIVLGKSGEINVACHLPSGNELCRIGELGRFSDAILMAAKASTPDDVSFELSFHGRSWAKGTLCGLTSADADALTRAEVGSYAWSVARSFDLSHSTLVHVDQLLAQRNELRLAHEMLMENPEATTIEITFDEEPDLNREVCFPIAFSVQLGESVCIIAGAMLGVPSRIEATGRYTLVRRRWRRYRYAVLSTGDPLPQNREQILEIIAASLSDGAEVCRWWDRPQGQSGGVSHQSAS